MRYSGLCVAVYLIFTASTISQATETIPSRSTCGFQEFTETNDLAEVGLDEIPWVALIEFTLHSGEKKFLCSGSLISSRYVLTAAHCTTAGRIGNLTSVRFGEYSTESEVDCKLPNNCNQRPVDVEVEEITSHPNYTSADRNHYNDIALLRLKKDVPYSRFIKPVCLPEPNESSTTGDMLTLAKWSRNDGKVTVKEKLKLPLVSKEQCDLIFSKFVTLKDSQFCAGGQAGRDACVGDGGGPIFRATKTNPLQWYQEGIVSFGRSPCGLEGYPSVYTKVAYYLPWIYSTVRD